MIKVNGARGAVLLGFGGMSVVFGLAYLPTPISIIPPIPLGLGLIDSLIPLGYWGGLWFLIGLYLIFGAFRQDQSRAMALFAGMCAVWGLSYTWAWITGMVEGNPTSSRLWVASTVYMSFLVACIGISRLVNAPVQRVRELIAEIEEGNH
ncbi:hypothetical protein SEA_SUPPI_23 [Arthrobacter phage Suppi]|uniref:Uncharacterized protein n=3 Tax=Korravirus TaxID=1982076 RepID=A0A1D8ESL8_9CAUD|nr:minor tail protein [Arthrobacter phage Litotes]AOT24051.1 hypothetical protein SEA_SUPPI_23 [Arthrobacter phage Suppi]ASR83259.1 hypothetical protein SEA_CANOWICAKTE_23 [Arthrobacter phage Canowicakte]AZS08744.1 hypothetical protein SEA_LITOTES_23 [Arthrobacter phage Litotes]QHB47193.1 hypothetical protein SEA_APPLECIDER_23 [Arthrobacter phage AppleCider]